LLAVLLLALGLLTLLGLTGLSSGTLINLWVDMLLTWFGWGAVLMPLSLAWIGFTLLAHNLGQPMPVRWGRVIAAEGAAFALLGLLNFANGNSVSLAAAGRGGGVVGWGVGLLFAQIFPPPTDAFALGALFLVCLFFTASATADRIARVLDWIQSQGFEPEAPAPPKQRDAERVRPGAAAPTPAPVTVRDSKRAQAPAPKPKPLLGTAGDRKLKISAAERVRVPVETADDEVKIKPKRRDKRLPGLDLLDDSDLRRPAQKDIDDTASIIVKTLKEFGVPVKVAGAKVGPSVTQFQVEPGFIEKPGPDGMGKQWKVRVAQIASLRDDLALALSASTLRIEAPVPGQNYVGIEVPHRRTSLVALRPVMESEAFQKINSPLAIALGRDVSGAAITADLGSMPHLLIAGTTGSGKSVCIVSIIACLVTNNTPDDLRLVLIDPKMVELVRFNGLPHIYGKVETDLD
ncbi:MAG: DNA translocase FtsK 4TM domain-containing protein, partial [Anaerolineales bacterium]